MVEIGDTIPAFDRPTDGDGQISSDSLKGAPFVLYFYPRDSTPGCTKEAEAFRDQIGDFEGLNIRIIGVSRDTITKHDKFKAKYELPFPLISDEDGSLCEAFGVWVEKKNYGKTYMGIERSTFLVDADGVIREIWRKVRVAGHVEKVLEAAKKL